jgi:hypothetical protein
MPRYRRFAKATDLSRKWEENSAATKAVPAIPRAFSDREAEQPANHEESQ